MPPVYWTDQAADDVERLEGFLLPKSQEAATRALLAIYEAVDQLEQSPEIGRPMDGMSPDYRELIAPFSNSGYVVQYTFDGRLVLILAIRHMREAGY
jgi:plasmid stabilization system protein ParE